MWLSCCSFYRSTCFIVCIVLSLSFQSNATTKEFKSVKVSEYFFIQDSEHRRITCAKVGEQWLSGRLRLNFQFQSDFSKVIRLKRKLRSVAREKLSKIRVKLRNAQKSAKKNTELCIIERNRIDNQSPNPTPSPYYNPLEPMAQPLTRKDVNHLFARAALGYADPYLMQRGLIDGADALVNQLFMNRDDSIANQLARQYLTPQGAVTEWGMLYYHMMKLVYTQEPVKNHLCLIHLHDMIPVSGTAVNQDIPHIFLLEHYFTNLCNTWQDGSYKNLIKRITVDPAMLIWLDGRTNTKHRPNENYARELLELFTVGVKNPQGEPNYTDLDVAQAARALTGWEVREQEQQLVSVFNPDNHDHGVKVIFRNTPHQAQITDGESLVNLIFDQHPNTARHIAKRIAERYLRPDIATANPELVEALALDLKLNDFNVVSTLKKLLKSKVFYERENYHSTIRSPVELTVHFFRALLSTGAPIGPDPFSYGHVLGLANAGGQMIGRPPSVFGWNRALEYADGSRHIALANVVTNIMMNGNFNSMNSIYPWHYKKLYPPGNTMPTDLQVIEHISNLMGVSLNSQQKNIMRRFMNNQLTEVNTDGQIEYVLVRDPWKPEIYVQARRKLLGLLRMFWGMPEFRLY